jgi:hypothetical protein
MLKLKLVAATGIATAALGAGALVSAPEASARPALSCEVALKVAAAYDAMGDAFASMGDYVGSNLWHGRAQGVRDTACRL